MKRYYAEEGKDFEEVIFAYEYDMASFLFYLLISLYWYLDIAMISTKHIRLYRIHWEGLTSRHLFQIFSHYGWKCESHQYPYGGNFTLHGTKVNR